MPKLIIAFKNFVVKITVEPSMMIKDLQSHQVSNHRHASVAVSFIQIEQFSEYIKSQGKVLFGNVFQCPQFVEISLMLLFYYLHELLLEWRQLSIIQPELIDVFWD